jgi:hypothetical protein
MDINKPNPSLGNQNQTVFFNKIPYLLVVYASLILFNGLATAVLRGPVEAISPFVLFKEGLPEKLIFAYFIIGASLVLYSIPFYVGAFGFNKLKLWSWQLLRISSVIGTVVIFCFYVFLVFGVITGKRIDIKTFLDPLTELAPLIIFFVFLSKNKSAFDSSRKLLNQTNLAIMTLFSILLVIGFVGWSKYLQVQTFNKLQTDLQNIAKTQEQNRFLFNQPSLPPGIKSQDVGVSSSFAERLQNGNTLIAGYNGWIVEIDKNGNIVWSYGQKTGDNAVKTVYYATRLANGNTLITDLEDKQVVEVSPDKNIVWTWSDPVLQPKFAQRLENGNTLITASDNMGDNTTVLEVLPTCDKTLCPSRDIVWRYSGGRSNSFVQATRLANGNTLIVSTRINGDGIIEVNHEGKIVWQYGKGKSFSNAYQLSDSSTLVAQRNCSACKEGYIFIVNKNGDLLWLFTDMANYGDRTFFSISPTQSGTILFTSGHQVFELEKSSKNIIWAVR